MITKIGALIIGAGIVLAFGGVATSQYFTAKQVENLKGEPVIVTKTIIVTPTNVPTATPSAVKVFIPKKVSK